MTRPAFIDRLTPRAGAKLQLFSAAAVWAVGGTILLVRGLFYVINHSWPVMVVGVGLALAIAIPKSRFILNGVARKAVARILERDHACYFGFFSWKTWLFVIAMMSGGIWLRHTIVNPRGLVAGLMGALYLGIGSALLFADHIFWLGAFASLRGRGNMPGPGAEESEGNAR